MLTDKFEGKPYLSPNDVCLDMAGNIYFTDPSNETPEAPSVLFIELSTDEEGHSARNRLEVSERPCSHSRPEEAHRG